MCGIAGLFGTPWKPAVVARRLDAMVASLTHRGPDGQGTMIDAAGRAALGHTRLSILDRSPTGDQPMADPSGRYRMVFNGEIYNYRELRHELAGRYPFRGHGDTETLLAAYCHWGEACLDRLLGMFAFLIWDTEERCLFAARDRFGVKPLYLHRGAAGSLLVASELKALFAAGVPAEPDAATWATYLAHGAYDHGTATFWQGIEALPAGTALTWQQGQLTTRRWYDLAARIGAETDSRPTAEVEEDYLALLEESVALRFRADVPVGINLSGGLDSSTLLTLVDRAQGTDRNCKAFTFITGDPRYDELPWVTRMVEATDHPLVVCPLRADEVPALATVVQRNQEEPFGGLPTLAYARLFETARQEGVTVLLDGQGMDEQWAGYDYYRQTGANQSAPTLQGSRDRPVRPDCLTPGFRALARPFAPPQPTGDPLRDMQLRDLLHTKIPRALRFNDRVSMRASTELREPFLDHRLVELALRQPRAHKIRDDQGKALLRKMMAALLPQQVATAPKRALQTPQREWLRGPLRPWAEDQIEAALSTLGDTWLAPQRVRARWHAFADGEGDNSFFVWQWISLGLSGVGTGRGVGAPEASSV